MQKWIKLCVSFPMNDDSVLGSETVANVRNVPTGMRKVCSRELRGTKSVVSRKLEYQCGCSFGYSAASVPPPTILAVRFDRASVGIDAADETEMKFTSQSDDVD